MLVSPEAVPASRTNDTPGRPSGGSAQVNVIVLPVIVAERFVGGST